MPSRFASLCQQFVRPSSGHKTGKGQSSSQFPRRVVPKNVLTIGQFHSSPMLAGCHHRLNGHEFQQAPGVIDREAWCAVVHDWVTELNWTEPLLAMLKILHDRLQHYANQELTDGQGGFRKEWGSRDQNAIIHWIIEKAREFRKNIFLCFIDYTEAFDCVHRGKLWNALTGMGMPEYFTCLLRNLYAVKKQQLEPCMEQLIGSRLKKEYDRAVCCHPVCLTYMLNTSSEMLGWRSYKL